MSLHLSSRPSTLLSPNRSNQRLKILLNHVNGTFHSSSLSPRYFHTTKALKLNSESISTRTTPASESRENERSNHLKSIKIGDLELLPYKSSPTPLTNIQSLLSLHSSNQVILQHIYWLLQKLYIGQDCILIGPPGSLKRRLAFEVARILNAEVEYVSITRDVNESDLKQRREITKQRAHYVDQAVVRAALEGRILILDSLERAERNLLPLMNNLLENREMALEDGRLMIRYERWKELQEDPNTTLSDKVVPVHPNFRVIALSLPVPPFQGNPLDPPLRSRFQAREVHEEDLSALIQLPTDTGVEWDHTLITKVLQLLQSISTSMQHLEISARKATQLPPFSVSHAEDFLIFLHKCRDVLSVDMIEDWLKSFYPVQFISRDASVVESIQETLRSGSTEIANHMRCGTESEDLSFAVTPGKSGARSLTLKRSHRTVQLPLPQSAIASPLPNQSSFVPIANHINILQKMLISHSLKRDICLIGRRSSGKSTLAHRFASLVGLESTVFPCYADMTSRDLLLSRATDSEGNTIWKESPLICCMREGQLCILDNVHSLDKHILMTLHTLIQDRQLFLSDGSRWVSAGNYDDMLNTGFTEEQLAESQVHRIHPSFAIMALALFPEKGEKNWFSSETLQLFHYHILRDLTLNDEQELVQAIVDQAPLRKTMTQDEKQHVRESLHKIISFKNDYNTEMQNRPSKKKSKEISMREVLRIAHALMEYPHNVSMVSSIEQITMLRLLPSRLKSDVLKMMHKHGIDSSKHHEASHLHMTVTEDAVQIGAFSCPRKKNADPTLVPKPFYVDTDEHVRCMRGLLLDQAMHSLVKSPGFHSLLIGNQGVGKNLLTYALLNALNTEMEYMQLHRDITTYSLTVQPSVIDGVLTYTDSPLVKAVMHGRTLLLDECDKCPLEIISIIRSLLADGEMVLADGRRIVTDISEHTSKEKLIEVHKDFRVIALANRGGFPFHGNNFFDDCGDLFQTQYVDNPSGENQLQMLQSYAPDVDHKILEKLIACFEDLKSLNAEGLLQYPYSTRELISIAKHMQAFPKDGIVSAIGNVVSFDHFNERAFTQLRIIFERHGIPLKSNQKMDIRLAPAKSMMLKHAGNLALRETVHVTQPAESVVVTNFTRVSESLMLHAQQFGSITTNHRAKIFTEHRMSIDCSSMDLRSPIVSLPDKSIHALDQSSPPHLVSFHPPHYQKHTKYDLSSLQHLSSPHIAPLGTKNQLVLFGTSYVVSESLQIGFAKARNVAFYFLVIDPRKSSAPCEKLLCHVTSWKHSDAFHLRSHEAADGDGSRFTLWARGNYEFHIATLHDESASFRMVHVGKNIQNLEYLSPYEYLLTTNDQHQHLLRIDDEHHVTLTRLVSEVQEFDKPLQLNSSKTLQQQFATVDSKGGVHFVSAASQEKMQVLSAFDSEGNTPTKVLGPKYTKDLLIGEASGAKGLKFIDLERKISLDIPMVPSNHHSESSPVVHATHLAGEDAHSSLVTLHQDRHLRIWDINSTTLQSEARYWSQLVGGGAKEPMRLEFDYHNDNLTLNGPKHGKEDNKQHVGGNTYAGGSGGRDTAGLGGVGGPYRLEKKGQNVYQLSDEVKKNVSQEALERARKMGREAYQKSLSAIDMSDHEMSSYMEFYERVKDQVHHLRDLLENLRAKDQDRTWVKGQTSGELDESKIIEAVLGEESIYKRRAKKEELNTTFQQKKPKTLRFLVDVSGSMYRFNGMDKRLLRMMELVVLLMESLDGFEHKFRYEIVGHSGEISRLVFVPFDKPPKDQKERLKVILKMHAHSQFCWSGDSTLEATHEAIQSAAQEEDSDERIVFCFSDANLARYGISPKRFGEVLVSESDVKAFAIFLAGLGNEAENALTQMPHEHAFVCKDTRFLSKVFEEIFTSHVIED